MKLFEKFKTYGSFIYKNKIKAVIICYILWIACCDQNDIPSQITVMHDIQSLSEEKQYYIDKIRNDSIMLNELKTNDHNLEKYAREHYYMKATNEDVFEIVER